MYTVKYTPSLLPNARIHTHNLCPCHFLIAPLAVTELTPAFRFISVARLKQASCGFQVCVAADCLLYGYTMRSQGQLGGFAL